MSCELSAVLTARLSIRLGKQGAGYFLGRPNLPALQIEPLTVGITVGYCNTTGVSVLEWEIIMIWCRFFPRWFLALRPLTCKTDISTGCICLGYENQQQLKSNVFIGYASIFTHIFIAQVDSVVVYLTSGFSNSLSHRFISDEFSSLSHRFISKMNSVIVYL